jgi:hypothetical protein
VSLDADATHPVKSREWIMLNQPDKDGLRRIKSPTDVMMTGLICPECKELFPSPDALAAHYNQDHAKGATGDRKVSITPPRPRRTPTVSSVPSREMDMDGAVQVNHQHFLLLSHSDKLSRHCMQHTRSDQFGSAQTTIACRFIGG